jgi:hypothetical protein
LEAEGVRFDGRGRLSLTRYGWGSVLSGRGGDGWESEYRNLESHSNRRRSD